MRLTLVDKNNGVWVEDVSKKTSQAELERDIYACLNGVKGWVKFTGVNGYVYILPHMRLAESIIQITE